MHREIQENIKDILIIETVYSLLDYKEKYSGLRSSECQLSHRYVSKNIEKNSVVWGILQKEFFDEDKLSKTLYSFLSLVKKKEGSVNQKDDRVTPFCELTVKKDVVQVNYKKEVAAVDRNNIHSDIFFEKRLSTSIHRIYNKSNKEYFFNMDRDRFIIYLLIYDFDYYRDVFLDKDGNYLLRSLGEEVYQTFCDQIPFYQKNYIANKSLEYFEKIVSDLENMSPTRDEIDELSIEERNKYNHNWKVFDSIVFNLTEEVDKYEKGYY